MSTEELVRHMFLEGQRKWPLVKLGFENFAGHCNRVLGAADIEEASREGADLYLCCACAEAQPEALRAFENEGMLVAKAAIARIDRDAEFVQDTLQEVWDRLLVGSEAKVKQYAGRGPLKAWVRVAATRVALDRCRSRGRVLARQVELTEHLAAQAVNPEAEMTRARFGAAFEQALRDAVLSLPAQDRNVLRMHTAGRCSIDEIGRAYKVHRATAARWLDRTRAQIYEAVRYQLCEKNDQLTASEFKSLATLMGSQLELTLTGVSTRVSTPRSDN